MSIVDLVIMRTIPDALVRLLLPSLVLLHLYVAPHTKVEESFNLQATHDILAYGVPTTNVEAYLEANYDHLTFAGAVPRTFVGALVLAAASKPGIWLGIEPQIAVRAALGLFNAFALLAFGSSVARAFGRSTATWYLLLQSCQFHVVYYASRTLPNMLAFGLTTLALREFLVPAATTSSILTKRLRLSVYLLTLSGTIFRSEIALLLFAHLLPLLVRRQYPLLLALVPAGLLGFVIALLITTPIDTFFWTTMPVPLWPEFSGLIFNVLQGRSSEWGTSPPLFYFANALPRLLLSPLSYQLGIPTALLMPPTRAPALAMLAPPVLFIALYSIQPHKEWRFIIYAVPPLTAVAALGADWIWTRRSKSLIYRFLALAFVASTLSGFLISAGMLWVSSLNYPGAEALTRVHALAAGGGPEVVRIHMDTLACTTGVTRFLQRDHTPGLRPQGDTETSVTWVYDKTEDTTSLQDPLFWEDFDWALAEDETKVLGEGWEVVEVVRGFKGMRLSKEPGAQGKRRTDGLVGWYGDFERLMRQKVTRGHWVAVEMQPLIRIMRHTPVRAW